MSQFICFAAAAFTLASGALHAEDVAGCTQALRSESNRPFHFTADSKFVFEHRPVADNAEAIEVRATEDGKSVAKVVWRGGPVSKFDLDSILYDEANRGLFGLVNEPFFYSSQEIYAWFAFGKLFRSRIIGSPHVADHDDIRSPVTPRSQRSGISLDHPYYLRTSVSAPIGYSATAATQFVNWRTGDTLTLHLVSPFTLDVLPEPFQSRFAVAAVLTENPKQINLIKLSSIEWEMAAAKKRLLSTSNRNGHTWTHSLRHENPVLRAEFSQDLPVLVTLTDSGVYVWDVSNGNNAGYFANATQFKILADQEALAYVDGAGSHIVSLESFQNVGHFPQVSALDFDSAFRSGSGDSFLVIEGTLYGLRQSGNAIKAVPIDISIQPGDQYSSFKRNGKTLGVLVRPPAPNYPAFAVHVHHLDEGGRTTHDVFPSQFGAPSLISPDGMEFVYRGRGEETHLVRFAELDKE